MDTSLSPLLNQVGHFFYAGDVSAITHAGQVFSFIEVLIVASSQFEEIGKFVMSLFKFT